MSAVGAFQVDLPKFELLEEVGHGGMATVYRARDRRLNREVAVKVIHRHLRENPEVARRFEAEALAVAKVKHPNIVEVYDVSSEEDTERYLVVELIVGMTLRRLLSERGRLPPEVAVCVAVEILRALGLAHRHGVIHRDIKPENVLLSLHSNDSEPSSGREAPVRVKLTDFGIAKLLDAQGVTHTGQVLGSPAHMAPEQIEGGDVDARSDVFAVGVLLYEMLTGVLPFEGKNPAQVLRRVLEGTFVPPERVEPTVGSSYGALVCRALAQKPADRFCSAAEFALELEGELARVGVASVREEIDRFLVAPEAYLAEYPERIAARLSELGHAARREGDVVRSAAAFNRALAYRPDDTLLLAAVTGLRHRTRYRRWLAQGTLGLGLFGLIVVSAMAGRWYRARGVGALPAPVTAASAVAAVSERPIRPTPSAVPGPEPSPATSASPEVPRVSKPRKPPSPRTEVPAPPVGTRVVRTPVIGPQNARVRIDGRVYPWFNSHELSIGEHTFEFLPPNEDCCEVPPLERVRIVEGEGPQVVRGIIRFRPATLELVGQRGGRASCGVAGTLESNQPRKVDLSQAELRVSCTIFAPPSNPAEPKVTAVALRPGQRVTLAGF